MGLSNNLSLQEPQSYFKIGQKKKPNFNVWKYCDPRFIFSLKKFL